MRKDIMNILGILARRRISIRRRLFWLLGGMSLATLLVVNLVWLPGAIRDIHETHGELQHVATRGVRDQIELFLDEKVQEITSQVLRFRPAFLAGDQDALRQLGQRFLQREPDYVEIGILDAQGRERVRVSRTLTITDRDLEDRSDAELFQEGRRGKVYWGPVMTTETSEPWVTLAVPLERSNGAVVGVVYGIINLKSLWEITESFQLSLSGRVYVVDTTGHLIAADDPNLVLRQLSVSDRPLIRHLLQQSSPQNKPLRGEYTNEHHERVMATGLPLISTGWGVVVEQPQSLLFASIKQKLWFHWPLCPGDIGDLRAGADLQPALHRSDHPLARRG